MGQPFEDVCRLEERLTQAQSQDIDWLYSLFENSSDDTPLEWSGCMTRLSRNQNKSPKPSIHFVFGSLLDSPPAHPDTIITTMEYLKNYLLCLRMTTVHISLDMQLDIVIQEKWSNLERWKGVVARPGGMHTLMKILGCIGKLMKGSGLQGHLRAAYSGLTGIFNGKSRGSCTHWGWCV